MDTKAFAVMSHLDSDILNSTYSYVIAPPVRLIAIYTLPNVFSQLFGISQARAVDAKDNSALSNLFLTVYA